MTAIAVLMSFALALSVHLSREQLSNTQPKEPS